MKLCYSKQLLLWPFFGLLRVSEIAKSSGSVRHVISVNDVSITNSILEIYIPSSKTDQYGKGCTVAIHAQSDQTMCPLKALQAYLNVRPPTLGPLFCHFDGSGHWRYQVVAIFKTILIIRWYWLFEVQFSFIPYWRSNEYIYGLFFLMIWSCVWAVGNRLLIGVI